MDQHSVEYYSLKYRVEQLEKKEKARQSGLGLGAVMIGMWIAGAELQGQAFSLASFIPSFLGGSVIGFLIVLAVYLCEEYVAQNGGKVLPYVAVMIGNFLAMYGLYFWRG